MTQIELHQLFTTAYANLSAMPAGLLDRLTEFTNPPSDKVIALIPTAIFNLPLVVPSTHQFTDGRRMLLVPVGRQNVVVFEDVPGGPAMRALYSQAFIPTSTNSSRRLVLTATFDPACRYTEIHRLIGYVKRLAANPDDCVFD